tara:strand:- start:212 stop:442 length:231 start_codon:yes stop_codon:yes gene_type:complete
MTEWDYLSQYQANLRGRASSQGFDVSDGGFLVESPSGDSYLQFRTRPKRRKAAQPGVEWLIPALLVVAAGAILLSR